MSKNDSKLLTKVSSLIPGQVPEFVETDHSLFVKFLKDYYQFLEAGRITLSTTINYVTLETTNVSYVLNETDETRIARHSREGGNLGNNLLNSLDSNFRGNDGVVILECAIHN